MMSKGPDQGGVLTLPAPVLIVEDEPLVQQWLASILIQLGYHAEMLCFASSLSEARARRGNRNPGDFGLEYRRRHSCCAARRCYGLRA